MANELNEGEGFANAAAVEYLMENKEQLYEVMHLQDYN